MPRSGRRRHQMTFSLAQTIAILLGGILLTLAFTKKSSILYAAPAGQGPIGQYLGSLDNRGVYLVDRGSIQCYVVESVSVGDVTLSCVKP